MWAAPAALFLVCLNYFFGAAAPRPGHLGHAPAIVTAALTPFYAFSYAMAAGLGVWESGRLRKGAVWELAAVRSRYAIARQALLPLLVVVWLMPTLSVTMALVETGAVPTVAALRPLLLVYVLIAAHMVIGFTVGLFLPAVVATPVLTVTVFVVVANTRATGEWWQRHVSGQFSETLRYGEVAGFTALLPHLVFTGSVAASLLLLWTALRPAALRIALALAVAAGGMTWAYEEAAPWGRTPPLDTVSAPLACAGERPRVCVAEGESETLPAVRKAAESVVRDYRKAGLRQLPTTVVEAQVDGRHRKPAPEGVWKAPFDFGLRHGTLRYQIASAAIGHPCPRPDLATSRAVGEWAATVTHELPAHRARIAQEQEPGVNNAKVRAASRKQVQKVLRTPAAHQGAWFERSLTAACEGGDS